MEGARALADLAARAQDDHTVEDTAHEFAAVVHSARGAAGTYLAPLANFVGERLLNTAS